MLALVIQLFATAKIDVPNVEEEHLGKYCGYDP
jgi:hypothetical protein